MISYVESLTPQELAQLPNNSLKTRILAIFKAYGGGERFLDFWLQKDEGKITAALCRFSGELWLLSSADADFEEIAEFSRIVASGLLTDEATAQKLGFCKTDEAYELEAAFEPQGKIGQTVSPAALYDILISGADGDITIPDKNEWYADVSHRLRHGAAEAVIEEDAAALAGFVCDASALITGVAVRKDARGKGKGRRAVERICKTLAPKKVFVEAGDKTAAFYEKCGFVKSGILVRCKTE